MFDCFFPTWSLMQKSVPIYGEYKFHKWDKCSYWNTYFALLACQGDCAFPVWHRAFTTLCVSQAPCITFIHNFNCLDQILWLIAMCLPEDDYKAFVSSLDVHSNHLVLPFSHLGFNLVGEVSRLALSFANVKISSHRYVNPRHRDYQTFYLPFFWDTGMFPIAIPMVHLHKSGRFSCRTPFQLKCASWFWQSHNVGTDEEPCMFSDLQGLDVFIGEYNDVTSSLGNQPIEQLQPVKCKKTELRGIPMIGRIGIRISDD